MAQINYSREKLENMSQITIKDAEKVIEKYAKDPKASPADKQGWESTISQLEEVHDKITQAYKLAKSYGVDFAGKKQDLLTLTEIYNAMNEQVNDGGKSAAQVGNIMDQIDDLKIGSSEKEKFKTWAKDKNLSGKLATGILGFGVAEMALSALGVGKTAAAAGTVTAEGAAVAAGTVTAEGAAVAAGGSAVGSILGTVVPQGLSFLGSAITTLWNTSPLGFLAIAVPLAMKAWPHVKSFFNKHDKSKAKTVASQLDEFSAYHQDGATQNKQNEKSGQTQTAENQTSSSLQENGITPADFESLADYNKAQETINECMDKLGKLQDELEGLTTKLKELVDDLDVCLKNGDKKNPENLESAATDIKQEIEKVQSQVNDKIEEIEAEEKKLDAANMKLSQKSGKTSTLMTMISNLKAAKGSNRAKTATETTLANAGNAIENFGNKLDKAKEAAKKEEKGKEQPAEETATKEEKGKEQPAEEQHSIDNLDPTIKARLGEVAGKVETYLTSSQKGRKYLNVDQVRHVYSDKLPKGQEQNTSKYAELFGLTEAEITEKGPALDLVFTMLETYLDEKSQHKTGRKALGKAKEAAAQAGVSFEDTAAQKQ